MRSASMRYGGSGAAAAATRGRGAGRVRIAPVESGLKPRARSESSDPAVGGDTDAESDVHVESAAVASKLAVESGAAIAS